MDEQLHAMLNQSGYAMQASVVPLAMLDVLRTQTQNINVGSGLRFATTSLSSANLVAQGPMRDLARQIIGSEARVTRSVLFDKSPESNWLVPWHQDLTIAVKLRAELPGWGPWSVKEGIPHVQPPAQVLAQMITLRLHLDDTPAENGALRICPGSHARGIHPTHQIPAIRAELGEITCSASIGDVLLMRPLLLHASSKSTIPQRRRVLHVEYASVSLPYPLIWAEGSE